MTEAHWTVTAALGAFPLLVVLAFVKLTPRRAALASYVLGWLFLPVASVELFGFLDYDKSTAVPLVVTAAIALFDGRRLARFRLQRVDLPMLVFCAVPLASSLGNDLGWYDGLSGVLYQLIGWGLPYLAGRLYCSTDDGLRELAAAVVGGGLLYVPFCLWEVRMSPQLHRLVYGYHQHDWVQTLRLGGYRPMVFMHHGLMVGLWMAVATLAGFALWRGRVVRSVLGVPLWLAVPSLLVVTVLCKSLGAFVLLVVGIVSLLGMRWLRVSLPVAILVLLPFVWVGGRITGSWTWDEIGALTGSIEAQRASSLEYRILAEDQVLEKALLKPVFGWGGWDRHLRVQDARGLRGAGQHESIATDSLWIITLGRYGFIGLAAVMLALAVPIVALWRRWPPRHWDADRHSTVAWVLALILAIYAIDSVFNNTENPIFLLIAGGLAGLPALRRSTRGGSRPLRVVRPVPMRTIPARGPR